MNHKEQEKVWASEDNLHHYWNTDKQRSQWFAHKINKNIKSVYEVGCNSGRNLDFILNNRPDIKVGGIDINDKAIEFVKNKIPQGDFICSSIYDSLWLDGNKYDMVFTSGVLLHVVPDKIEEVIKKMILKSNKFIFHMETIGDGTILNSSDPEKAKEKVDSKLYWFPDICKIYKGFGLNPVVVNIPCGGQDARHLIIIDLNKKEDAYNDIMLNKKRIKHWLKEISMRCSMSKPGPWTYTKNKDGYYDIYIDNGEFDTKVCTSYSEKEAIFISHSPNDVRLLARMGEFFLSIYN